MDRIYSNQSCCSCSEEGKIFHIDQRSMSVFQQQCRPHLQALFLLLLLFENCSCSLFKSSNQMSVTTAVDAFWVSDLSWSSSSFNWRLLPRYVLCTLGASCHKHQSNAIFFMAAWIFLHSLGWHSVKAVSWFMSVVSFWGHALITAVTRQRQMRSSQSKRARREFQPSCPPHFLLYVNKARLSHYKAIERWFVCVCVDRCAPLAVVSVALTQAWRCNEAVCLYRSLLPPHARFPHSPSPLASLSLYFFSSSFFFLSPCFCLCLSFLRSLCIRTGHIFVIINFKKLKEQFPDH